MATYPNKFVELIQSSYLNEHFAANSNEEMAFPGSCDSQPTPAWAARAASKVSRDEKPKIFLSFFLCFDLVFKFQFNLFNSKMKSKMFPSSQKFLEHFQLHLWQSASVRVSIKMLLTRKNKVHILHTTKMSLRMNELPVHLVDNSFNWVLRNGTFIASSSLCDDSRRSSFA